jgi:hypothetical protein
MNNDMLIKLIIFCSALGLILLNLSIKLVYYILIKNKLNKFHIKLDQIMDTFNMSVFCNSKSIYRKIKNIKTQDEINILIEKIEEQILNPFNLKKIDIDQNPELLNNFNCVICLESSTDYEYDYDININFDNNENNIPYNENNLSYNENVLIEAQKQIQILLDTKKIYELNCKHIFHLKCINNWLQIKNKCPLCNQHAYFLRNI